MTENKTPDTTENIERLLCEAADWEPGFAAPADLVRRALQPRHRARHRLTRQAWIMSGALAAVTLTFLFSQTLAPVSVTPAATASLRQPTTATQRPAERQRGLARKRLPVTVPQRPARWLASATVAPRPQSSESASLVKSVSVLLPAALTRPAMENRVRHSAARHKRHLHLRSHPAPATEPMLPDTTPPHDAAVVAQESPVMLVPVVIADQVPTEDGQGMREIYTPALVAVALNTTGSGAIAEPDPVVGTPEPSIPAQVSPGETIPAPTISAP